MASLTPTEAGTLSTPGPDLGAIEDAGDGAAGEWDSLDYPDPIDHGHGLEMVVNDLDDGEDFAYRRLFHGWREHVADAENEPYVLVEDVHEWFDWLHDEYPAHLVLSSKPWKVGTEADGQRITGSRRYEYSIQVMRYDPESDTLAANHEKSLRAPVSCQTWVQPQNEDLVYKSNDPLICQYGEGTKFRTQTTYAGSAETIARTVQVVNAAMDALDQDRPDWSRMNRESWRVWKGEVHHRIDESLMDVVANKLRSARTLVEYGGDGDASGGGQYAGGQHVEERVVSDMWHRIGFAGYADRDDYNLGLKVYRVGGNPADERLRHPKLEAFFGGTDDGTTLPHADEWAALRATLRQLVSTFAIRSGVALGDLREDDYYQPMERDQIDVIVPKGWRQAMAEANEERERRILKTTYESLSQARWDVLWTVATTKGCEYDTLVELTGYSRDYVREIVRDLEEKDVLHRTTYPRVVVYHNEELRLNAIEALQQVHPDRALDDIRADADERREERRTQREDDNEDSDGADSATDESGDETGSDDSPTWVSVADLDYSAADVGRYLERGEIEPDAAKVNVDRHDWLILR
ncbi:hypothetical protein [Haloarcula halophila]|uniref:hypothetical protein n=1 Tax=Haloarcula TaxID=2237 RepID=UPI0023E44FAF|nr:hypothetical protein [Halomicroarcula sp. DFY41]